MTDIGVRKQVQLPWGKSVRMAWDGIRVELRRSVLTGLSIICALAFVSYVWIDADILSSLRRAAADDPQLARKLMVAGRMEESDSQAQRKKLLVIMALIVCTVGISNAMAMSVTERFQIIGTMKCLGALDSFIVRLFVLEAVFLGLSGTLAGIVLGTLLAVLREMFAFGSPVLWNLPGSDVAIKGGYAILVGMGISLIGALYPAIVAARMHPVEAMRVTT